MVGYTQLAYGLDRGGIDERWLGSTSPAANENRTTPNAERRTPNAERQTPTKKAPLPANVYPHARLRERRQNPREILAKLFLHRHRIVTFAC